MPSDGWVPGQAGFTSSHKGGDPRVQETRVGSGWDVKIKNCEFLSCTLARVYNPAHVLCVALVAGWVAGCVAVQQPPPHPRGDGTILGPWFSQNLDGWARD